MVSDKKEEKKIFKTPEEEIAQTLAENPVEAIASMISPTPSEQEKEQIKALMDSYQLHLHHKTNPYTLALSEIVTHASNMRTNRKKKRGEDYEEVWQTMKPTWVVGIICTKALRMDDAITKNLITEIDENIIDMFNYLVFLWAMVRGYV